ncbi:MAG TPA: fatty acid desaturase, partial [Nannocystaceae bacterium]|nr:fatty acid desaturase [Nannocystaceae bacterium]
VLFAAIGLVFGRLALLAWVSQALVATIVIAAVNYFDHWGLQRGTQRIGPQHAWDCDCPLGTYLLLGLPHHADHHLHAARSFDRLAAQADSPKLPHGYVRMVLLVLFADARARRMLRTELARFGR